MKLAILGGGGVRIPAFIRGVLGGPIAGAFDEIALFEPNQVRRETMGQLSAWVAQCLGRPEAVTVTDDLEAALDAADFVFSAIRVGGDQARVIDEEVALRRGLVGQETTGSGGCAMALRTIPVLLSYCKVIARCAPRAVLINFTNPAGLITQAVSLHSNVAVVGVCDTPAQTVASLAAFLGAQQAGIGYSYSGLNHCGWVTSLTIEGEEQVGQLLDRYEELARTDHTFGGFDPVSVRRTGAIPTEYVYYYDDPQRYVDAVARAGTSRGQDVALFNEKLLTAVAKALSDGSPYDAWLAYSDIMGMRSATYMRTDTGAEPLVSQPSADDAEDHRPIGYEGVALAVIDGLTGRHPGQVVINTRNGSALGFLDPDDTVEVPALVHGGGVAPLATAPLPQSARGLITCIKAYEREVVSAAVSGDASLAAHALALHPLVPGVTVAREMLNEYRERHGRHLAYLQ
ncbi:MAG TPA: hypothetical protein VGS19_21500 [Streptosporangiaceae bacterium]|nr:hypothetical protein [Streptosporangiaceae bacterium]